MEVFFLLKNFWIRYLKSNGEKGMKGKGFFMFIGFLNNLFLVFVCIFFLEEVVKLIVVKVVKCKGKVSEI